MQRKTKTYINYLLKILFVLALISTLAVGTVSILVLRRLMGQPSHETTEQRDARRKNAHKIFDQMGSKKITCTSADGVVLNGLVIERKNAKGVVVLCHGYHRDKENMVRFIDLFPQYTLVLFDFRGHGASEQTRISIGCHEYKDVVTVTTWAKQNLADARKRMLVFGVSMGASATVKALALHPHLADGAILDSAFACLDDEIAHIFTKYTGLPRVPFLPLMSHIFRWIHGQEAHEMKPEAYMKLIHIPVLLIHSSTDAFTLPEHSVRLYASAKHNKSATLWIGPPAQHTRLYKLHPEKYKEKLEQFLSVVDL